MTDANKDLVKKFDFTLDANDLQDSWRFLEANEPDKTDGARGAWMDGLSIRLIENEAVVTRIKSVDNQWSENRVELISHSPVEEDILKNREVLLDMKGLKVVLKAITSNKSPNPIKIKVGEFEDSFKVSIESEEGTYTVGGLDPEIYPHALPSCLSGEDEEVERLELPLAGFEQALGQVAFSISTDLARPPIATASLEYSRRDKTLSLATTDGHRLTRIFLPLDDAGADMMNNAELAFSGAKADSILIDSLAVSTILKSKMKVASVHLLRVQLGDGYLEFTGEDGKKIWSKVVCYSFPDYERVIRPFDESKINKNMMIVDVKEFGTLIKRVKPFTDKYKQASYLEIADSKVTLTATDESRDISMAVEVPTKKNNFITPRKVCLNLKYLEELIKSTEQDELLINIPDAPSTPVEVRHPNNLSEYVHVLMPINIY